MLDKLRSYFRQEKKKQSLPPEHKERIEKLETIIGTSIDNPFIYIRALRHRSVLADRNYSAVDSYERLEFLGDAVLDLVVTEIIFDLYPEKEEGFLTKLRAKIVRGEALAYYANELGLNDLMVLGERARGQGIEFSKSVLADLFEALVGAIYVDRSYEETSSFVSNVISECVDFSEIEDTLDNYKSILLEFAQAHQMAIPEYEVISEYGPGHDKTFEIRVLVDGREQGTGKGKSKKQAEQRAAQMALDNLTE